MDQQNVKIDNPQLDQGTAPQCPTIDQRADKLIGTILDDKIQIESLIGHGGMSVVYKGTHLVLNRPVAIKIILPGLGFNDRAVLRLQQEAKAAYSLSHPNLASVHDVSVTSDGLPYLVMDFAAGETLSDMLKSGPLEPVQAIDIFGQVCAGLKAAHAQGVIHRDIKPGNIMVEHLANGCELVKIVDFGIAKKVTENAEEIQKLTQTGEVFGTPLYMSPEQCRGDKLDQRSDIYSLGCVFYEALTGAAPFIGDTSIATIMMHLAKPAPKPPKHLNLSAELVNVLLRCLEKKGKDRYQSMAELEQDLQALKAGGKTAKKYFKKTNIGRPILTLIIVSSVLAIIGMNVASTIMRCQSISPIYNYRTLNECSDKIAHSPDDAKAYLTRARFFYARREYAKAVADLTDCIKLSKAPAYAYAHRAETYRHLRRYQEAVADCNSALALEPGNMMALRNRTMVYRHLHNYTQSLADADAFLKINPDDATILDTHARVLIALGRYKEAIKDCTEAIKIKPTMPEPYTDRAKANNFLLDSKSAIADASEAIRLNRDPLAYTWRAYALSQLNQYDKAQLDIETALQLQPGQVQAMLVKAQILKAMAKVK